MSNSISPDLNLRPAKPDDAAMLAEFAELSFRDAFESVNTPQDIELYVADAFAFETLQQILLDSDVETVICLAGNELAGYVELWSTPGPDCIAEQDLLEIRRLYVGKSWQGRGVAQELLAAAKAAAQRRHARALWLGVWEHNPRAVGFYRKCGFVAVGTHPFVLGTDQQTDLVMSCRVEELNLD